MYFVYQFDISEDPTSLSKILWQQKVSHRIVSNGDISELWIADPSQHSAITELVRLWKEDPAILESIQPKLSSKPQFSFWSAFRQFKAFPATISLLLLSSLMAVFTQLGKDLSLVSYFTITPFEVLGGQIRFYPLSNVLSKGEYWRLFTPALLHFSVMHIVFNALWVWDIGRKLERILGSIVWSAGVLLVAILSNVLQYEMSGYPIFGGLSGVVYGLIGFAWLTPILKSNWPLIISKQLMVFFLVWLAIGFTSFTEMIGLGSIANTAHVIGLLSGLLLSVLYKLLTKSQSL